MADPNDVTIPRPLSSGATDQPNAAQSGTPQIPDPPAGALDTPPQSAIPPAPTGALDTPPAKETDQAIADRSNQYKTDAWKSIINHVEARDLAGAAHSFYSLFQNPDESVDPAEIAKGAVKSAGQTVNTVSEGLSKVLPSIVRPQDVAALKGAETLSNPSQETGAGLETLAEFMLGEEALKGIEGLTRTQKLAKLMPSMKMLENSPKLMKTISAAYRVAKMTGVSSAVAAAHPEEGQTRGQAAQAGAIGGALFGTGAEALSSVAALPRAIESALRPTTETVGSTEVPVRGTGKLANLAQKAVPDTMKQFATEQTGPAVAQGVGQVAKEAAGTEGVVSPDQHDRLGIRGVADEVKSRSQDVFKKLDEVSGNMLSEAQTMADDASGDFTSAGRKEYRQAMDLQDAIFENYKNHSELQGMDLDQAKADWRKQIALRDISKKLTGATESSETGNLDYQFKQGKQLSEAVDSLVKNDKDVLQRAGFSDTHIDQLQKFGRIIRQQADTPKFATWMGGVARTLSGALGAHTAGLSGLLTGAAAESGAEHAGGWLADRMLGKVLTTPAALPILTEGFSKNIDPAIVTNQLKSAIATADPGWAAKTGEILSNLWHDESGHLAIPGTGNDWTPPVDLEKGIPHDEPIDTEIPLSKISVSNRALDKTQIDNISGRGPKTKGPVSVFYNIDNGQYLVEDGMHRIAKAQSQGKQTIPAKLWSAGYSDTIANVRPEERAKLGTNTQTVGTSEGAKADTAFFQQAKEELGEDASFSSIAKRAQEMKTQANLSGPGAEGAGSVEAINRANTEKAQGVKRVVVDTRTGQERPLIGVDAVDYQAKPYESVEFRGGNRDGEVIDQGQSVRPYQRKYSGEERRGNERKTMNAAELEDAMKNRKPIHTPFNDTEGAMQTIARDQNMPKHPGDAISKTFVPADHDEYANAVKQNPQSATLTDPESMKDNRVFSNGEGVYYSISPDGDLQGVINNSGKKGALASVMPDAIKNGAKSLDAWDIYLPKQYEKYGFERTASVPYDVKQYGEPPQELQDAWKQQGWKEGDPYPSVQYMKLPEAPTGRVGQRKPTGRAETGHDPSLNLGMDVINKAGADKPEYLQKLADKVAQYPTMKYAPEGADESFDPEAMATTDPHKILNNFVKQAADNIEWLHNQVPPDIREMSKNWYDSANAMTKDQAEKYGISHPQAAAVTAVLSPQNPWDNNISLANRVLDVWKNRQNFKWSPEMSKKAASLLGQSKNIDDALELIHGKTFAQLKDADPETEAAMKGLWTRVYDEAHNPRTFERWAPDGTTRGIARNAGGAPANASWFSTLPISKAISVLEDGSMDNIHEQLGNAHKVRNFYNNIIDPNSKMGDTTIDTHAVGVAHLSPFGTESQEVLHNFGTAAQNAKYGLKGTYPLYAEAYKQAADRLGIQPRQLQSITWEGIRSLFKDKSPELQGAVRDIWKDHQDGNITIDDARKRIIEAAGGFKPTDWQSDIGANETTEQPANATGVSRTGVSQEEPQTQPRGRSRTAGAVSTSGAARQSQIENVYKAVTGGK